METKGHECRGAHEGRRSAPFITRAPGFRVYLDNSMNLLLAAGYAVTNDPGSIDLLGADASMRSSRTRVPTGRLRP